MIKKYKAFLFDLNGTMIDDMSFHIKAWHQILNKLGANISLEKTKEECYGKNHELLERTFPSRFTDAEKDEMSYEKEKAYQQEFRSQLKLIDGLDELLIECRKHDIKTAIGSAAIMFNIDFVLDGLNIRQYINAIVSADDVMNSKPNPETYLKCAELLNVNPTECLVFEDALKGVESAQNAAMDCWVLTTMHQPEEFSQYQNIVGYSNNFLHPKLLF